MAYTGYMEVEGWVKKESNGVRTGGKGSIKSNDRYVAGELAKSLPHGIGYAIDTAADIYKFNKEYKDD
ncbi:hypothetical protein DRH29_03555 [candidate division Kazan bacterium]|uniref:Uncharacterized protein n=1 Tax=candidate division Kazan bacterium TaxID=2202143 RepID=A0A420ZBY7_UNCK3|nr:MAG: hypothetical protein DRH29_03555 [candidate division Kazan bacterium]